MIRQRFDENPLQTIGIQPFRAMTGFMRSIIFTAVVLLLAAGGAAAAPDVQSLVDQMVKRDAEMVQRRAGFTYDLSMTRSKLDKNNREGESKTEKRTMRGSEVIDYGTRKDNGVEQDLERASKEEPFELLKMMDHYTFRLEGEESVHGQPCWKVRYTPKKNMPFRNREEKVLNHVSGTLWIKQDDASLMRNRGKLIKPVSVAWFFATLGDLEFSYDSMKLPNGDYGPARVAYQFKVNIMLGEMRERHVRTMTAYRK